MFIPFTVITRDKLFLTFKKNGMYCCMPSELLRYRETVISYSKETFQTFICEIEGAENNITKHTTLFKIHAGKENNELQCDKQEVTTTIETIT